MDKRDEVPVSPQSVSEMQPFYEKCWDSWQSCSDVWPKLLPWWVRRFAGEWADSRVQAALAPLRADLEAATNELTEIHKIVGGDGEWVAEDVQEGVRAALRDMERQLAELVHRPENTPFTVLLADLKRNFGDLTYDVKLEMARAESAEQQLAELLALCDTGERCLICGAVRYVHLGDKVVGHRADCRLQKLRAASPPVEGGEGVKNGNR